MSDNFQYYESPHAAIAGALTLEIGQPRWPLVEICVVPYDADGLVCFPVAGTFLVEVKTVVNESFEEFPFNEIDATQIVTVTVGGTIRAVRITPTAVSGDSVTTYKMRVLARRNE